MNPVLKKDILGSLRQRRAAAMQVLFLLTLCILVLATWPQQGVVSLASRGQDSLLLGLILGQLVLLVLFIPGVASISITAEREQGTLEMLYASRLTAWQLIVGKVLSAIGYPILLLTSGLPFVAMLSYRGDVDLNGLLWAYLVLIVTAVLLALMSLAISACCRQSSTALVITYVAVLMLCGGVLVPAAIMLASSGGTAAQALHSVRSVSPVAAMLSLLRPNLAEFGGREGGIDPNTGDLTERLLPAWKLFLPVAGGIIVICLGVLVAVLRKAPAHSGNVTAPSARQAGSRRSLAHRILFLVDPNKQRKPFGRFNPVIAKEARTNQLGSARWMIRIFYGALFVSMMLALMAMYGGQTEHGDLLRYVAAVIVAFQVAVIAIIDPSLTSPAVSAEIENGTFEILRLTPLTSSQIFWGKFVPAFLPALLPIVALIPAFATICFVNHIYISSFVMMLPVFAMSVALCCTAGLCCSAFVSSTARSTVINYFLVATVVVMPMVAWFASGTILEPRLAAWLAMPSPLVIALNQLPGGSPDLAELWRAHLIFTGVLVVGLLIVARFRLTQLLRKG